MTREGLQLRALVELGELPTWSNVFVCFFLKSLWKLGAKSKLRREKRELSERFLGVPDQELSPVIGGFLQQQLCGAGSSGLAELWKCSKAQDLDQGGSVQPG